MFRMSANPWATWSFFQKPDAFQLGLFLILDTHPPVRPPTCIQINWQTPSLDAPFGSLGSPSNLSFVQGFQGKEGMRGGMPQPPQPTLGQTGRLRLVGSFNAPNIVIFRYWTQKSFLVCSWLFTSCISSYPCHVKTCSKKCEEHWTRKNRNLNQRLHGIRWWCCSMGATPMWGGDKELYMMSKYMQYTYIHTYMHTYIHTYMHACIHTYIQTYIPTYIPTYLPTYVCGFYGQHPS